MSPVLFIVLVILVIFTIKYVFGHSESNPFANDCREPLKKQVYDKKEKNKVLKQGFLSSKVPDNLDAVIIGSGVGGLGLAVLLAKVGKKVLVLEQHDQAGGCCHTFTEKGFEFDVGIHYVGDLLGHTPFRCMLDQMTNGQLQWEPLEDAYDHVLLGPQEKRRSYPIYSGRARFPEELKKHFPREEKAIDEYMRLAEAAYAFFPPGSSGKRPKDASFAMHSLLVTHYLNGAWYPKGGSSEIAYHMIPIIEKAGGAVLVRAPVNRILFNDAQEAYGVSVMKGQEEVHIHAPMVISDAGIFNTYEKLLPKELQATPAIQKQLSMVQHGEGGLSIFVGLNGTKEELGLKANNYWIFVENNFDELVEKYLNERREEASRKIPLLFVASPSAKDPSWEERSPGKSTLTLVSFAKYSWFEEWKDGKVTNRGADYKELKQAFIDSALDVVMDVFPKITREKIEYVDAGTPITNTHYIGAPKGEFYGVDHGFTRFSPELNATIRAQTPLKNLYLTGQDVFLCGFAGALVGALSCGSVILNRNLHLDSIVLALKTKYLNKKLKAE